RKQRSRDLWPGCLRRGHLGARADGRRLSPEGDAGRAATATTGDENSCESRQKHTAWPCVECRQHQEHSSLPCAGSTPRAAAEWFGKTDINRDWIASWYGPPYAGRKGADG